MVTRERPAERVAVRGGNGGWVEWREFEIGMRSQIGSVERYLTQITHDLQFIKCRSLTNGEHVSRGLSFIAFGVWRASGLRRHSAQCSVAVLPGFPTACDW